jgi:RNA polymerase sigma-70 factor (ECF subfamily)
MDLTSFDGFVSAHHAEIHRFCARVTGRASTADDLSQETFLRAYRAYAALPASANARAWVFAIAANLCRNHFRSEKRRRLAHAAVQAISGDSGPPEPERETLFNEGVALIEHAIAGLPLKQRLAFVMRKLHDLEYDQVAESLNCSAESARAHVFQALRKVRQSLNGHHLLVTEPTR